MTVPTNNPLGPANSPREDRRQSDAASDISRGVVRLLRAHGLVTIPEFTLACGRRADVMGLSDKGAIWILEIKSSRADFRADTKWPEYLEFCDRFFFAVAPDFPTEMLPPETGLVLADRYGGVIERQPREALLPPARRKALTLRFARAAAERLARLHDPDLAARIDAFNS